MSRDTLVAASAIYQSLFNNKTIGHKDEETNTTILVDTFKDVKLFDEDELDLATKKSLNDYLSKKFQNFNSIEEMTEPQRDFLLGR